MHSPSATFFDILILRIGQKTPFKTFPGAEGLLRGSILFVVHRRAQEAKEEGKDPLQWIRLC